MYSSFGFLEMISGDRGKKLFEKSGSWDKLSLEYKMTNEERAKKWQNFGKGMSKAGWIGIILITIPMIILAVILLL